MIDPYQVAVKDHVVRGIKLKVTCRKCGRDRIVEGGILQRNFPETTSIHQYQLNRFAKRLICGNCGSRWPAAKLVVAP